MTHVLGAGAQMPSFDLDGVPGDRLSSAALSGTPYVLFVYPKDDTSGCTKEALAFAAHHDAFTALGVRVFGCSKDDVQSHAKFIAKHGLPFPLLSDPDVELIEALGSWGEKSMYGKTYMGADRSTFLVDGNGVLVQVWRKVKVPGHAEAVLASAKQLLATAA